MRILLSGLRKLQRRPATWLTFGILTGLLDEMLPERERARRAGGVETLWREAVILAAMGTSLLAIASLRFRKRLG